MATSLTALISMLIVLQALDFILTLKRILRPDVANGEPVAKFFIKKLSLATISLAIKALIIAPAVWALNNHPLSSITDLLVLIGANLFYVWIIVPHLKWN